MLQILVVSNENVKSDRRYAVCLVEIHVVNGGGGREAKSWKDRWNASVRPNGDVWPDVTTRRPPQMDETRKLPRWLRDKLLLVSQEMNVARWFLYWFLRRGRGVTRGQVNALNILRKEETERQVNDTD